MIDEIILSIKPKFANEIYNGNKSVELRKKIGSKFRPNVKVYIYSSSPESKISGYAYIQEIQTLSVQQIKNLHLDNACISQSDFDSYYEGHDSGVLLWLYGVIKYETGVSLAQLKEKGLTAPQSFCYVPNTLRSWLEDTV